MNKHGHSISLICLCPLSLAVMLNFNLSKEVLSTGAERGEYSYKWREAVLWASCRLKFVRYWVALMWLKGHSYWRCTTLAIILAMREPMRDEQTSGISRCKSISVSVSRFDLLYLFERLSLKGPQREILRSLQNQGTITITMTMTMTI